MINYTQSNNKLNKNLKIIDNNIWENLTKEIKKKKIKGCKYRIYKHNKQ